MIKEHFKEDSEKIMVGLFIFFVVIPLFRLDSYVLHVQTMAFFFAALAISWDILGGFTGQLCLGHAALFGVGAYTAGLSSLYLAINPWLGLLLGGAIATIFGLSFSMPALRLRGPYLALTTLGLAEGARIVLASWSEVTGGWVGFWGYSRVLGVQHGKVAYYYLVLGWVLFLYITTVFFIKKSKLGLLFNSIREDEIRAETLGINTKFYKTVAFTLSSFIAGVTGALYTSYIPTVDPGTLDIFISIQIIAMVVVGGRGTIVGPVVGALFFENTYEYLRMFGVVWNLVATGIALVAVVLLVPEGIIGYLDQKAHERRLAREMRRRNEGNKNVGS